MEIRGKQKPCEANQPSSFLNRHVLGQKCNNLKLITYSLMADWYHQSTIQKSCICPWYLKFITKRLQQLLLDHTRGDSSNKGCFGRKTNLFRESGDFAGNRDTWEVFREIWDIFGTLTLNKDLILHVIKQYNMHSDIHPLYALVYFMYFDPWKQFNSPWYDKTNQQRFQLK